MPQNIPYAQVLHKIPYSSIDDTSSVPVSFYIVCCTVYALNDYVHYVIQNVNRCNTDAIGNIERAVAHTMRTLYPMSENE